MALILKLFRCSERDMDMEGLVVYDSLKAGSTDVQLLGLPWRPSNVTMLTLSSIEYLPYCKKKIDSFSGESEWLVPNMPYHLASVLQCLRKSNELPSKSKTKDTTYNLKERVKKQVIYTNQGLQYSWLSLLLSLLLVLGYDVGMMATFL